MSAFGPESFAGLDRRCGIRIIHSETMAPALILVLHLLKIMISRNQRKTLAENLLKLINGQITTDEFTWTEPGKCDDLAIEPIWGFAYSLYDDLWPYRLTGKRAISPETREIVERCVLFLQSDLEYQWPDLIDSKICQRHDRLFVFSWANSVVSLFIGTYVMAAIGFALLSLSVIGFSYWWVQDKQLAKERIETFQEIRNVWPFREIAEFENTSRKAQLRG